MDLISKYDLIEKIVQTTDENILWQVKHVLDEQNTESWDDMHPKLKESLKRGLAQSDKGEVRLHEEIWPKLKKKYSKK